jgi:hypothetical protein
MARYSACLEDAGSAPQLVPHPVFHSVRCSVPQVAQESQAPVVSVLGLRARA